MALDTFALQPCGCLFHKGTQMRELRADETELISGGEDGMCLAADAQDGDGASDFGAEDDGGAAAVGAVVVTVAVTIAQVVTGWLSSIGGNTPPPTTSPEGGIRN